MASGVQNVEASSTSSSSLPVILMMLRVLPKGSTVLMSFLVMSPASMVARMPPPLVMAASTASPSCVAFHTSASVIRSPRFVSSVRLPGAFSPLRVTSVLANTVPYSASTSAMMAAARAAISLSAGISMPSVGTHSVVMALSLMVTTPMFSSLVPVEVRMVSPTLRSALVFSTISSSVEWEWPSMNTSMPVTLPSRSMERLAVVAVSSSIPRWPMQMT